jgi:glycosyltransferase involved in cell wall biosynthesis
MALAQEQREQEIRSAQPTAIAEVRRVFLMLNSFETGGSERQFVSLARSLDPQQFSISLGCIQTKGPLRDLFGDVPRFKLGGSVYGWKSWHSRWQLARHLRKNRIQIAHAFDFYTNLTLVPAALAVGVPVVIGSQRQLGDLLTPAQRRLQHAALSMCDAVVCNSRASAERLISDGLSESKIRVIGNALASEAFSAVDPLIPRRDGIMRVGMIARMNSLAKNHRVFLQASAKLACRFPSVEFVLAGDGPLRAQLEAEATALGIGDRTIFLGDRRDIPAVMASLDVTVVPSDSESLSNVILESMAAGVPVVATNVGGNPELVSDDRGVLVPVRDVDLLAEATAQLLNDANHRARLGRSARQFALAHFSADNITREYESLYTELSARKTANSASSRVQKPISKQLKIAIVGPSLNYVGGQSVQLDLLLRYWSGDPDVDATFIPVDPEFPAGLRWVRRVPGLRTIIRTPFYLVGLWRGLRDADIAHMFSASYSSFLVAPTPAWLVARLRGKRTIIHYHSGEARDHLRTSRIARYLLRQVNGVVTPSAYLVDVFREFGLKAVPIPNLVDLSQFIYRERKPLRPLLVCTRGFHPYYCVDVVVKAFAAVREEFPEATLDLVGGGPLEGDIRKLVLDLSLSGVNFCGVASRNQIGKYYDRADIFINASRLDNMPVTVLEAYASGTPVVSTSPEGINYLVQHERTGLLSPVGDADALAANIIRVLRDPQLASRLISGGLEQLEQYRWDVVQEQWLNIYRSLAPEKSIIRKHSA